MPGSAVTLRNISKFFGAFPALRDVGLEIRPGEFFSLLGPSGCGKTTALRIIAGLEQPDSGDVLLDGVSVLAVPPHQRPVNTVFQSYALFPHLSVFENVAFALRLRKTDEPTVRRTVAEHLALVKLPDEGAKFPAQLSGGQKQRVAIARALVCGPRVLLLDEPLAALDAKLRQHMLVELDAIHDAVGVTFIYVTHDQEEALGVSDRVAVMHAGRVLQVGAPREIYDRPAGGFVAQFIGENNFFSGRVARVTGGDLARVEVPGLGEITVRTSPVPAAGALVRLAVRPEKLRLAAGPPAGSPVNVVTGTVDEVIYAGHASKFFVKLADGSVVKIFCQHDQADICAIKWQDQVSVWWEEEDGYLVRE